MKKLWLALLPLALCADTLKVGSYTAPLLISGWQDVVVSDYKYDVLVKKNSGPNSTFLYLSSANQVSSVNGGYVEFGLEPRANSAAEEMGVGRLLLSAYYAGNDKNLKSVKFGSYGESTMLAATIGIAPEVLSAGGFMLSIPLQIGYTHLKYDLGSVVIFGGPGTILNLDDGNAYKGNDMYAGMHGFSYGAAVEASYTLGNITLFAKAGWQGTNFSPYLNVGGEKPTSGELFKGTINSDESTISYNTGNKLNPFSTASQTIEGLTLSFGAGLVFGETKAGREAKQRQLQERIEAGKREREAEEAARQAEAVRMAEMAHQAELAREAKRKADEEKLQKLIKAQKCYLTKESWVYLSDACSDTFAQGKGKARSYDGMKRFKGEFEQGEFKQGRLFENGVLVFDGPFSESMPHGKGVCTYEDMPERCEFYYGKRIDELHKMRLQQQKAAQAQPEASTPQPQQSQSAYPSGGGQYIEPEPEPEDPLGNALEEAGKAALNCAAGLAAKEACKNLPWPGNDICIAAARSQFPECIK